jgi:hypothetical protein
MGGNDALKSLLPRFLTLTRRGKSLEDYRQQVRCFAADKSPDRAYAPVYISMGRGGYGYLISAGNEESSEDVLEYYNYMTVGRHRMCFLAVCGKIFVSPDYFWLYWGVRKIG